VVRGENYPKRGGGEQMGLTEEEEKKLAELVETLDIALKRELVVIFRRLADIIEKGNVS
jgi:hypothetical protein